MKHPIIVISIILVFLYLTLAIADDDFQSQKVPSIHQRMSAVPSSRKGPSRAWENNKIATIDRNIKTLLRYRRDSSNVNPKSVTPYPKHHSLQPIDLPLDEAHPKQDLNSTTAPYTDYHHSWKETPVILQQ